MWQAIQGTRLRAALDEMSREIYSKEHRGDLERLKGRMKEGGL